MNRALTRLQYAAEQLVEEVRRFAENHEPCERCLPTHDGKPNVRPHSIPGWWQVWSGGICIALLAPEDIAPILAAGREALATAAKPPPKRSNG